jgi:hypothetical protein
MPSHDALYELDIASGLLAVSESTVTTTETARHWSLRSKGANASPLSSEHNGYFVHVNNVAATLTLVHFHIPIHHPGSRAHVLCNGRLAYFLSHASSGSTWKSSATVVAAVVGRRLQFISMPQPCCDDYLHWQHCRE